MAIKVLYLLHKLTFGGTERVVVNLVNSSTKRSKNHICSFFEPNKKFLKEIDHSKGIIVSLNKRDGNDFSIPFKVSSLCRDFDIDIIHSLGWGTYFEGLLASRLGRKKRKFIYSFRGKTIEDTISIPRRRIIAQNIFSKFCDALLTPSEESRRQYANDINIDPQKITVIYNGVDIGKFNNFDIDLLNNSRKSLGITKDHTVIGSVARFDPVKNISALIKAFSRLNDMILKGCKLLLVGDGPEMLELKEIANDSGSADNIIFTGMQQDIPYFLKMMDIYVQPSRYEGIPNSVLEAMAAGLPVIATKVGGVPEIVDNGLSGILIDPQSDEQLIEAIEILTRQKNKRLKMGSYAQKKISMRFSITEMVHNYETLYEKIMLEKNMPSKTTIINF